VSTVIEVENVSKCFPARRGARDLRGRGGLRDWVLGHRQEMFTAIRDISFTVGAGESLGIIGRNGSGKSTLLSILAGVTLPSGGRVTVNGRVASLLELGAGFHPVLTGRENVYLNAGLLGMRHAQTDAVFDDIVRFSGIGDFIDQPVETYSSGMYVRIGFAVAVHSNPDIFLVDEVLSVGDEEFQRRCRVKIGELREQGKTIVFVSHDLGVVNTLCERVVLLSNGLMVDRGSTQKTINYYLRQVGAEKGIHTFSGGDSEVIHCEGRVSLFHKKEELSGSGGFQMEINSYGQLHLSSMAEWTIEEKDGHGCTARGRMPRLPVELVWKMWLDEAGRLFWELALECERETQIEHIAALMGFPTSYARWLYGDFAGPFPEILPSDTRWSMVVAQENKQREAVLLPEKGRTLPPVIARVESDNPHYGVVLFNSEYIKFNRMVMAAAAYPQHACLFKPGRHDLMRVVLDLNRTESELENMIRAPRMLECGPLTVQFKNGSLCLFHHGEELTNYLNVYSSMLIQQLWNDSQSLQWGAAQVIEGGISLTGTSRRFPFCQHWELRRGGDALRLQIWLETFETLEVQECHVSALLRHEYDQWRTEHEQGRFAPFEPEGTHWVHFNRSYAPGRSVTALCGTLPSVTIAADGDCPAVRMTVLNTTLQENSRGIQALRPSESGRLCFEPGRHLYFSGWIRIGSEAEGGGAKAASAE
jgi:ABC-type polysaccharide/polyol phosphate transport system ATPase subunit